ncbi:helix-turn-helix domain-containing protein [Pseudomonas gingeri]|uniref:Helix-turn-helix transcriptional regulator n=1 Tax=Pseudomonas gingeri TaxID=117681 RepID=A0A7Y8BIL7_9PSED|nr:helix-turn-helix transcriptional regulator [Pseudomonas gingeri]NWB45060.1 helix-turn-helix transcriptional regulator [Pseudomonas gingeri]
MELKQAFGAALKRIRKNKGLTQEDFSQVSSRTYLSTLERGIKSPTIEKIEELASVIDVHPLTILTSCYLLQDEELSVEELFHRVRSELALTRAN